MRLNKRLFFSILKTALLIYFVIFIAAFLLQNQLLFHPTAKTPPPSYYGLDGFNETVIRTEDNVKLTAWFYHAPGNEKTILYFYGNADTLANYPEFFKDFADGGYNVLAINYRGYGGSKGKPSEAGFYLDGKAALKFLERYSDIQNVIVVGRSLGTGVAVELASKNDVGGLVLISPYTTINAVAEKVYWFLPVKYISRFKFDSLAKIPLVKCPVLIIHGEADNLIPYSEAEALNRALDSQNGATNSSTGPINAPNGANSAQNGSIKPRHTLIKYPGGHLDLDKNRIASDIMKFFADGSDAAH